MEPRPSLSTKVLGLALKGSRVQGNQSRVGNWVGGGKTLSSLSLQMIFFFAILTSSFVDLSSCLRFKTVACARTSFPTISTFLGGEGRGWMELCSPGLPRFEAP